MKAKFLLAAVLVLGVSAAASAQTIGDRSRNERERIFEGRRDGDLTRGEAFRLNQDQRRIDNEFYRDRRFHDGYLTPRERRRIRREQRMESRRIYMMRHHHEYRYY